MMTIEEAIEALKNDDDKKRVFFICSIGNSLRLLLRHAPREVDARDCIDDVVSLYFEQDFYDELLREWYDDYVADWSFTSYDAAIAAIRPLFADGWELGCEVIEDYETGEIRDAYTNELIVPGDDTLRPPSA